MKPLRALWRGLRATAHVVRGLWIIRTEFGRLTPAQTDLLVREWSRGLLRILGVTLTVRGEQPAGGPLLQVANHTSWLDIIVMNAARPSRFVSKADARHWPLLGSLIAGARSDEVNREVLPFLAAAIGVVLLITFVPAVSLWLPSVIGGR